MINNNNQTSISISVDDIINAFRERIGYLQTELILMKIQIEKLQLEINNKNNEIENLRRID